MAQFVLTRPRVPPPQGAEAEVAPGIFRPSGQPYYREGYDGGGDVVKTIDHALRENALPVESQVEVSGPRVAPLGRRALGGVRLASEVSPESLAGAREQNARILGRAALSECVSSETSQNSPKPQTNLADIFKLASKGEKEARERLEADAASEVIEMACKTGTEMVAHAKMVDGKLVQFGMDTEQRQFNTLTTFTHHFAGLQKMTEAEGQNAFMIEELYARGLLKSRNKVVEISLVPDESYASLKGSGLFLREVIAIIRVTEVDEQDNVTIKSYLLGGTDQSKLPAITDAKSAADEELIEIQALKKRYDIAAVRQVLHKLGVAGVDDLSPAEILSKPLYLTADQHGKHIDGIDIAMMYDAVVEELTGKQCMMGSVGLYQAAAAGQALTRAHYKAHFAKMHALQQNLQEVGGTVARTCAERWQEVKGDMYAAGRLMHTIAEKETVRYLAACLKKKVENSPARRPRAEFDLTVFGAVTYQELQRYQQGLMKGDLQGAAQALNRAEQSAKGTGCPAGMKNAGKNGTLSSGENEAPVYGKDNRKPEETSNSDEKKKWRWTKGVCRIKNCPTRPKTTMVGPCTVCWSCQKKFNKGVDPSVAYARMVVKKSQGKKKDFILQHKKSDY